MRKNSRKFAWNERCDCAFFPTVTWNVYAGLGMTPAEIAGRYRAYASDCVSLAQSTSDAASKLRLLDMGRAWLDLADQAEKNGRTVLIYETPDRTLKKSGSR